MSDRPVYEIPVDVGLGAGAVVPEGFAATHPSEFGPPPAWPTPPQAASSQATPQAPQAPVAQAAPVAPVASAPAAPLVPPVSSEAQMPQFTPPAPPANEANPHSESGSPVNPVTHHGASHSDLLAGSVPFPTDEDFASPRLPFTFTDPNVAAYPTQISDHDFDPIGSWEREALAEQFVAAPADWQATPAAEMPPLRPITQPLPTIVGAATSGGHADTPLVPPAPLSPESFLPARIPVASLDGLDVQSLPETLRQADPDLIAALRSVGPAGASDLHITAGNRPMLRVDGRLIALELPVWDAAKTASSLLSALDGRRRAKFEQELELDWALSLSDSERFRVNYYVQRGSVGAAFRLIPTRIRSLGELGMPAQVAKFASLPRGLVLVTGPTGSGKSTTLAALVDLINQSRPDHIVTVEDPIEYLHTGKRSIVNQREVGEDTRSFASALKHVLRQDPDVILFGEMRDLETIQVALTAAETGHLVFATLHTQSAAQTIDRVIDVFPPHQQNQVRSQLSVTLRGVVCQTLVPVAQGPGRIPATELLVMTPGIANVIREGKSFQVPSMLQAGGNDGMHTMDQHLALLVNEGRISYDVAVDRVQDLETFDRMVRRLQGA